MTDPATALRLPRELENDSRYPSVQEALARGLRPLWSEGRLDVPHVAFEPSLERALRAASGARKLERGLEQIEKLLGNEEHGLAALREKQGTGKSNRVSRLVVIADGGSERFYRSCEAVLHRHGDRVLGLRVAVSSSALGQSLYGKEAQVQALMVSDRVAVTQVLLSLVRPGEP